MRALFCCLSMASALTGCELLQQLLPDITDNDTEPAPNLSDSEPEGQHGERIIALHGGRLLHGDPILRIIDVRDPRRPRVEGTLNIPVQDLLFRIDDHVIYRTWPGYTTYPGEREDVDITRPRFALVNVDIADRAHPRLVNEIPARSARYYMVQGQGQAGSAVFMVEIPFDRGDRSQLARYELQGEQLVRTGQLDVTDDVARIESSGNKILLATSGQRISVIDSVAPELRVISETQSPSEFDPYADFFLIDGDQLRVMYQGANHPTIDTFDVTRDGVIGRSGRCLINSGGCASWLDRHLLSTRDDELFATNWYGELCQVRLDAFGNCPEVRDLGGGHHALHVPAAQRLLSLGSTFVHLLDTAWDSTEPVLASAQIEGAYNNEHPGAAPPIQVLNLQQPTTAADGTSEPWLVGLMYYGYDLPGYFQLLSASAHTLSPRSIISEDAFPERLALYGSTLVALASTQLRTFDIRDLQDPRELGQVDLNVAYSAVDRFGDYLVRVRIGETIGGAEPTQPRREVQIIRLDAPDEPPVATWPSTGRSHLKAEDLLLELGGQTIQAYDLSDPARPRTAGSIWVPELGETESYRTLGRALIIPQRKPTEEWKTIFTVVDFQDPDSPALAHPGLELQNSGAATGVLHGTSYYLVDPADFAFTAAKVDFADPRAPTMSGPVPIPGGIVAVTEADIYTTTAAFPWSDLTLSRVPWTGNASPPSATRTWRGRELSDLHANGGEYLYLTHRESSELPPGTEPRSDWALLEVLDAQSLATVGTLDIDTQAIIRGSADGRLLIEIPNALLFVDVRDPTHPTARAAVLHQPDSPVFMRDGRVYVTAPGGLRSYPTDLRNLLPPRTED